MAVGGKKTRMAEVAAAGRATGYVAGGISPHGQRKRIPVVTGASGARRGVLGRCPRGGAAGRGALDSADLGERGPRCRGGT